MAEDDEPRIPVTRKLRDMCAKHAADHRAAEQRIKLAYKSVSHHKLCVTPQQYATALNTYCVNTNIYPGYDAECCSAVVESIQFLLLFIDIDLDAVNWTEFWRHVGPVQLLYFLSTWRSVLANKPRITSTGMLRKTNYRYKDNMTALLDALNECAASRSLSYTFLNLLHTCFAR